MDNFQNSFRTQFFKVIEEIESEEKEKLATILEENMKITEDNSFDRTFGKLSRFSASKLEREIYVNLMNQDHSGIDPPRNGQIIYIFRRNKLNAFCLSSLDFLTITRRGHLILESSVSLTI